MYFSATASFTASLALSTVGLITLKKADSSSQFIFAGIPLIFGIQQFCEGMLWLALSNPEYSHLKSFFVYVFITFAQVIWPFWVPLSILLMEKKNTRRKLLYVFSTMGILVSIYLGYCLANYPVNVQTREHHIDYTLNYPSGLASIGVAMYLLAIIFIPFFSSINRMWLVSTVTLISFLAAKLIYSQFVISVWCFFAALISVVVWYMMVHLNDYHRFHKFKIRF